MENAAREEPMPAELWNRLREHLPEAGSGTNSSENVTMGPRFPSESCALLEGTGNGCWCGLGCTVVRCNFLFSGYDAHEDRSQFGQMGRGSETEIASKECRVCGLFQGFQKIISQKHIDSLYEALRPSVELNEHYNIISPADISDAVKRRRNLTI